MHKTTILEIVLFLLWYSVKRAYHYVLLLKMDVLECACLQELMT